MSFTAPVDIAYRALQHVGARRILSLTDNSKQAQEINFCYDKLRRAELRRSVWRFATRRAQLRPVSGSSLRYIPPVYSGSTAYVAGNVVMDSLGTYWICAVPNTGNQPGGTPPAGFPPYWVQYFGPILADTWTNAAGNTYNGGEIVTKTGPLFYINLFNGTSTDPAGGGNWVPLPFQSSQVPYLFEPAGVGMTVNTRGRNAYGLPNGYLRVASPDPKVESTSTLNTSGAIRYLDWQFEGNYIITSSASPILLRFVADVSDVPSMDDLFCELLAARIAYEICEPLSQSNIKLQAVAAAYQKFARDARMVNWLETGNTEPEEEEYELTRGPAGVVERPSQGGATDRTGPDQE